MLLDIKIATLGRNANNRMIFNGKIYYIKK